VRKRKDKYSIPELMACVFSREIENHTLGFIGAHALIPMAACSLAQKMHAPDLTWVSGGSGYINPSPPLTHSSSDYRDRAEAILPINRLLRIQGRHLDFFFAGGIQFDPQGATNLVGTRSSKTNNFSFRGPGSAGVTFLARARRVFYYTTRHDTLVFKKKVEFRSATPVRPQLTRKPLEAPLFHILVSSLGIFEFAPPDRSLSLVSLHPGISFSEVQKNTGFKLEEPSLKKPIPFTEPPTEEEMVILRDEIDPKGLLRRH
jgi:glutaconate CoA-transferase subunit B